MKSATAPGLGDQVPDQDRLAPHLRPLAQHRGDARRQTQVAQAWPAPDGRGHPRPRAADRPGDGLGLHPRARRTEEAWHPHRCHSTVVDILKEAGLDPEPERKQDVGRVRPTARGDLVGVGLPVGAEPDHEGVRGSVRAVLHPHPESSRLRIGGDRRAARAGVAFWPPRSRPQRAPTTTSRVTGRRNADSRRPTARPEAAAAQQFPADRVFGQDGSC